MSKNKQAENIGHVPITLVTHNGISQLTLLRLKSVYLHGPTTKSNSLTKVVCRCDMAIERLGIELGEDVDLVDLAVYAVAHRDVDEPVASPDGHLKASDNS